MRIIKIISKSRLFLMMTSISLLSLTIACNSDDEKNDSDSYKSVYGIWELEESSLGPGNVFSIEPNESVINFNVNAVASVESKAQKDYDKYFKVTGHHIYNFLPGDSLQFVNGRFAFTIKDSKLFISGHPDNSDVVFRFHRKQ